MIQINKDANFQMNQSNTLCVIEGKKLRYRYSRIVATDTLKRKDNDEDEPWFSATFHS